MKILVVEDKEMHRRAAEETLVGHELTIVKSFDEAMALMRERIDEAKMQQLMAEAGFSGQIIPGRWDDYSAARTKAEAASVIPFPFEAVLTDMMMPMGMRETLFDAFNPAEQVPYGFVIALKAALRGARFVAVVTDTNHHKGAMSAALDHFGGREFEHNHSNFVINGAKAIFVHTPFIKECVGKKPCEYSKCTEPGVLCSGCKGTREVDDIRWERKDWGKVLAALIAS